jgi:hypothetical protein
MRQPVVLGDFATPTEAEGAAKMATQIGLALGRPIEATVRYQVVGLTNGTITGQKAIKATGSTNGMLVCGFGDGAESKTQRGLSQHYRQAHRGRRPKKK